MDKKAYEEFLAKYEDNAEVWPYIEEIRNVTSRIRRVFPLEVYPKIHTPMNAPGVKVYLDFEDDPLYPDILVNIEIYKDRKIEWFIKNRATKDYYGNEVPECLSIAFNDLHKAFEKLK